MFRALTQRLAAAAPIHSTKTMSSSAGYQTIERGSLHTLDYRIFFKGPDGNLISPWHDIPLYASKQDKLFHMIVEIPRWTNAKMEMATKEPMSPIRQDEKSGLPRFVHNVFPHHGYLWNYGALPQTWEDPNHKDPNTQAQGDNDPIDVVEIGSRVHERGAVLQVKILGTLALLDEGETDWKLLAIDVRDELAPRLNNIGDVEKLMPGLLAATHEWFRVYKIPAGKGENRFAFNGQFKDREFAHQIIQETHEHWLALIRNPDPKPLNTECSLTALPDGGAPPAFPANRAAWDAYLAAQPPKGPAQAQPAHADKWYFVGPETAGGKQ